MGDQRCWQKYWSLQSSLSENNLWYNNICNNICKSLGMIMAAVNKKIVNINYPTITSVAALGDRIFQNGEHLLESSE